jgi:hypothetical protein
VNRVGWLALILGASAAIWILVDPHAFVETWVGLWNFVTAASGRLREVRK